jgi:pentatricopeptide repeat protein
VCVCDLHVARFVTILRLSLTFNVGCIMQVSVLLVKLPFHLPPPQPSPSPSSPASLSPGFTALMKAAGSCRGAEAVWAVYNAAVSARCADDRVCNTALSHLLHHGDLSGCRAVLEDMGARGVPRTEVTHRLVLRLEVAEGAGGSKKPRAGGRHQSTASSALSASPGTPAARVSP